MANWKSITKKIKTAPKTLRVAKAKAKKIFEQEKENFISEFLAHPVSREIMAGPLAENSSGTLGGYGNLSSFIGFNPTDAPIQNVVLLLKALLKFKGAKVPRGSKNSIEIVISVPTLEDFRMNTPLPWEPGRSWVIGIEGGISGFGSYMYEKSYGTHSRSGVAFQAKRPPDHLEPQIIRKGGFRNVKYMSELIRNFHKELKKREK